MASGNINVLDVAESEFEDLDIPPEDQEYQDDRDTAKGLIIPYRSIHEQPSNFKTPNRQCFIPGKPVTAKIIDVERTASTHFLNANLYVIQLNHGEHLWVIKRRYKHFQHLHQQLMLYRVTLSVPFPSRMHRERRETFRGERKGVGKTSGLPRFPKRPEALVAADHLQERRQALEDYLQNLLKIRAFRNHHETVEFLEVSHLSFVHGMGMKGKEGLVLKRTGTTRSQRWTTGLCPCFQFCRCCGETCGQWQRRWLVVKDSYIAYVRPKDGRLHCVMLFDAEFEVSSAMSDVSHGLVVANLSRRLVVKCWTKRKAKEWVEFLRKKLTTEVAQSFIADNRFSSYAPIRREVDATWFVDGSSYMSAVADALEAANEEIYIADWWLSPEIYMKRPIVEGEKWRLDKILQRKANQGVKVFIMLYKEVNLALGINSFYSKQKLVSCSENIKVLRHPDHVKAGILLWAHHEKLVIVDQMYAFVGGIDLCYGRWDDHKHRLTDLGSVSAHQKITGMMGLKLTSSKPGGAPNSSSLLQLAKATNMVTIGTLVDHKQMSRTPSPQTVIMEETQTAITTVDHLMTTENGGSSLTSETEFSSVETGVRFEGVPDQNGNPDIVLNGDGREGYALKESQSVDSISKFVDGNGNTVPLKGETPPTGRRAKLIRRMTKASKGLKEDSREWIDRHIRRKGSLEDTTSGSEAEEKEPEKEKPRPKSRKKRRHIKKRESEDSGAGESSAPNSPKPVEIEMKNKSRRKRSVGAVPIEENTIQGLQGSSKLWIGKDYTNFIVKDFADLDSPFTDLVDRSTTPRMPWHDIAVMVQGNAARDVARHFIQRWNAAKQEKARINAGYPFLVPKSYDFKNDQVPPVFRYNPKMSRTSSQVLRSVSTWSAGVHTIDDSIQQAYIDSIQRAQHFIYIENQFFITLAEANPNVQNRIGEALLGRILQAHREGKPFRIFVVIPLLPGFEGEVGTNRGVAIHAIVHWNYSSICRGKDSLFERLKAHGIEDPTQYLTFHGLRTWSELHGDLVTELIYVHSKLMIVDDNLVICGSANINDRSMIGKRDSEVAVIIQDEEFIQSMMNGQEYKAGKFAHSLRTQLFREHLGLLDSLEVDIRDPVSDNFYRNIWQKTATVNTAIYDEVFQCVPTDKCETFAHLEQYQTQHLLSITDPVRARVLLKDVRGYLVTLPLKFLCQENLLPATGTREALMPTQLWT